MTGDQVIANIVIGFLAASVALGADAADFRPLIKAGIDVGGETMVTAAFTSGETEKIRANESFYLGGGVAIINDAKDWEYHVTLAYKLASIEADNGEIEWTRVPLEALAFYRFPRVRVGGGLAYHINPRLEGSGVASGVDVKFKNALGAVLQADYLIWKGLAAGVRYTVLEYDAKGAFTGSSARSDGIGLTLSYTF